MSLRRAWGKKIAIVIDTFPNDTDLTTFWTEAKVAQSLSNIEKIQVVPGVLNAPSGEETLDVEWSSGIAPDAKIRIYATQQLFDIFIDEALQAIIDDLPTQPEMQQVSISLGSDELIGITVAQMQTDSQYFATRSRRWA